MALAAGVLALAAGHLAAGWLLANGLRTGALRIQDETPRQGFAVRALHNAEITLEAAEPVQDFGHPGVIGLSWPAGYGHMGEVLLAEDGRITRSFRMLQGDRPTVCPHGSVDDCPQVVPDSYAFPGDPGSVGLAFDEAAYQSPLGPMGAWVVPADGTGWAVHVHGWTAHRREALRMMPVLHRNGWTSMAIDYRNDAGAPRDPSGHHRFGLSEWEDVDGAVRYALDRGADEIVLVGYSTGAAHIVSFLERSALGDVVTALILDAPNLILAETVRHGSGDTKVPGLGIDANRMLLEVGMWIADLRWGVDWETTNYVQRADQAIRVPTLVFHGTSDSRVPISISRQLAARLPDLVRLEEAPAAGHVMSWNADPRRYESLVEAFLAQN